MLCTLAYSFISRPGRPVSAIISRRRFPIDLAGQSNYIVSWGICRGPHDLRYRNAYPALFRL